MIQPIMNPPAPVSSNDINDEGRENQPDSDADYSGNWRGTFSGTDTGTWQATVDSSGSVDGTGYSNDLRTNFSLDGYVGNNNTIFLK